ncbi:hypothetical protein [Ponticaulis sp.]|nr:hypothetical protein [Ponticaulis sp.]|tara:strand:+ start:2398 stop:2532 length:135 start_codon:yes stop_codon:yes gene_type:complete
MRGFLIILVVAIIAIGGGIFWLANYAENNPPHSGEQRIEVELDV